MWWGLTGIAAAVAIGSFLGWRVNNPGTSEWAVQIHATQDWTDTRVDCRSGDVLEIAATGTIYHKPGGRGFSPDENPDPKARGPTSRGSGMSTTPRSSEASAASRPISRWGRRRPISAMLWAGYFSASTTKGSTTTAGSSSPELMRGRSPGRAREAGVQQLRMLEQL
jgi:hypothetical protein